MSYVPPSTAYAFYESYASLKNQDRNVVKGPEATEYPRHIYQGQPFNPSVCQPLQYLAQNRPRDINIDYFVWADREDHPPNFSRFAYPWCPNGYCVGNHPGRYNTPEAFRWQTSAQPEGVAPDRFYKGRFIDPNYVSSDAYNLGFLARQESAANV